MPLLILMFPAAFVTALVVIVLAVIATFHKDGEQKFTAGSVVMVGVHFLALLAVSLSVLQIAFAGVEKWIPDLLTDSPWRLREAIEMSRYALAVLFIVSPIYLLMLWKEAKQSVTKVSWSNRFMSVTILLVAGLVAVTTLITLVYNFLSGELGVRMLVKILMLLIVSGGVAAYYQLFVRDITKNIKFITKLVVTTWTLVLLVAITLGFIITGGPTGARAERFDERRLSDLSDLQWQVQSYWQENKRMPDSLVDLHDPIRGYAIPTDPKTKEPYGYRIIETSEEELKDGIVRGVAVFELCAEFETEWRVEDGSVVYNDKISQEMSGSFLPSYYAGDDSPHWNHPVGKHCFERTIKEPINQ